MTKHRNYELDYLRGIMAVMVAIYHCMLFNNVEMSASDLWARVGFYGVSVFYILSGLAIYITYRNTDFTVPANVAKYAIKRIARVYPLFAMSTILVAFVINPMMGRDLVGQWTLIMNLSGLFSFFHWDGSVITGGWSIGNQIVFYSIFPIAILLLRERRTVLWAMLIASFLMTRMYFCYIEMAPDASIGSNWHHYTNYLNHIFLFLCGVTIGVTLVDRHFGNLLSATLIIVAGCIMYMYPAQGAPTRVVTGNNSIIFTAACILLVMGCFKLDCHYPKWIHAVLHRLGEISYGVYIFNAIVIDAVRRIGGRGMDVFDISIISITITIVLASISHRYLETYFIKWGKMITTSRS